jgi:hypothetical protein
MVKNKEAITNNLKTLVIKARVQIIKRTIETVLTLPLNQVRQRLKNYHVILQHLIIKISPKSPKFDVNILLTQNHNNLILKIMI